MQNLIPKKEITPRAKIKFDDNIMWGGVFEQRLISASYQVTLCIKYSTTLDTDRMAQNLEFWIYFTFNVLKKT